MTHDWTPIDIKPYLNAVRDDARRLAECYDPQALIDFHRKTFGGYKMMADGDGDGDSGAGDGDQGASSNDSGADDSGSQGGDADSDSSSDLGFPQNTRLAQMTLEQQVAYHKHQSRKHEQRATAYRDAVGGKSADEIKADLERQQRERMTEQERAVEDAKKEAREQTAREFGPKAVRTAFELALRNLPEQDRADLIDDLDLTRFLTDSGDVNTAKVLERAEKIAPADKDKGVRRYDFGGGHRGDTKPKTGVSAGAELFAATRNKSTS